MADLSDWTVLVVEDEDDTREVVEMILHGVGANVLSATSAEDALTLLSGPPSPTVVVIDLALPRMNGWELLTTMRKNPTLSHIPAVAMTAYHSIAVAQEAISAGFAAYFPKPLNSHTFADDLVEVINKATA